VGDIASAILGIFRGPSVREAWASGYCACLRKAETQLKEAEAEIARLRLTDDERDAIRVFASQYTRHWVLDERCATLRKLLDRTQ
jgi:hypothetical protein